MRRDQNGFSIIEVVILLAVALTIGLVGWFIFVHQAKGSGPLPSAELKTFLVEEVNSKSQASETQLREEINNIPFAGIGLVKEGEAYADYCEQQNESGTLNEYYVKRCTQTLALYFSSTNDITPINTDLTAVFKQDDRFISANPASGVCLGGQLKLSRNALVTYSKSKDLIINNQILGFYSVEPSDKDKTDKSCASIVNDISRGEDRYFIKSTMVDENNLNSRMLDKNSRSKVTLFFYRTYFKEAI